jgi:hypothetical protein
MNQLPIKRCLDEDNRLYTVHIKDTVYDLYCGSGDDKNTLYLTEHGQPDTIYMIITEEIWNAIFT